MPFAKTLNVSFFLLYNLNEIDSSKYWANIIYDNDSPTKAKRCAFVSINLKFFIKNNKSFAWLDWSLIKIQSPVYSTMKVPQIGK